jgi:hypothetical protein
MRWTPYAEREPKEKTKVRGESKQNFWYRWMAVETVRKVFLLWVPLTRLGSSMMHSEEDLRREFTSTCQTPKLGLECSSLRSKECQTLYRSKTLLNWELHPISILDPISRLCRRKPFSCRLENAKMPHVSSSYPVETLLHALRVTPMAKP